MRSKEPLSSTAKSRGCEAHLCLHSSSCCIINSMASRCLAGRQLKGVDAVTSVQRGSHHHDVSTASGNVGLERNASIRLCDVCHIAADHQPNRLSFEVPTSLLSL